MPPKSIKSPTGNNEDKQEDKIVDAEVTSQDSTSLAETKPNIAVEATIVPTEPIVTTSTDLAIRKEFQLPISERNVKIRCKQCYLEKRCKDYREDGECVYNNEVDLTNSNEMLITAKRLLSIQAERILTARIIEKVDGGAMDDNVGAELDRYMEMLKTMKDLGDYRDTIEIKAKGQGILTKIFGNSIKQQ